MYMCIAALNKVILLAQHYAVINGYLHLVYLFMDQQPDSITQPNTYDTNSDKWKLINKNGEQPALHAFAIGRHPMLAT